MNEARVTWTDRDTNTVIQMYKSGYGPEEIAARLGRSVTSIVTKANRLRLHKQLGIQLSNPHKHRAEPEIVADDRPYGWLITPEELDRRMAGRRFEDMRLKPSASMVSYSAPRRPSLIAEAVC